MFFNEGRWLNYGAPEYDDADPDALTVKEAGAIKSLQKAKIKILFFIAIIYGGVQIACCFMPMWHKWENEGTSVDIGLTSMKVSTSEDSLVPDFKEVDFPSTISKWKKIACRKIDFNGKEVEEDENHEETDEEAEVCSIMSKLKMGGVMTIAMAILVAVLLLLVSLYFLFIGAKRDTSCTVALLLLFIFIVHVGMVVIYALITRGVADLNPLFQTFNKDYELEPSKITYGAMYWITASVNTVLIIAMIVLCCSIIPDEDLTVDGEDDYRTTKKHGRDDYSLEHQQQQQFVPLMNGMGGMGGGPMMNENTLVPVLLFNNDQPEQTPLMGPSGGYNVRGPDNWFSY